MIKLIYKKQTAGITSGLPVMFSNNLRHELIHLLFKFDSPGALDKPALYVSEITFIQSEIVSPGESDKLLDAWLLRHRFENATDRNSFILPFRVGQEEYFIERKLPWGEVDQTTIFTLPNNMKLCFEPDLLELKNRPSKLLFSAVSSNMLWNDRKTFFEWFAGKGFMQN